MTGKLRNETREEYFLRLEKSIENLKNGDIIVCQGSDYLSSVDEAKLKMAQRAVQFFKTFEIDMSDQNFNRDEANER